MLFRTNELKKTIKKVRNNRSDAQLCVISVPFFFGHPLSMIRMYKSIYLLEGELNSVKCTVRLTRVPIPSDASVLSIDEFQIKFVVEKYILEIENLEIRKVNLMNRNLSSKRCHSFSLLFFLFLLLDTS